MGIKIKHKDPTINDFATKDLIVNVDSGSLWYKSKDTLFKVPTSTSVEEAAVWKDDSDNNGIIYNSGSVGINIDNPNYKLHVSGTGKFLDDLTVLGDIKVTGSLWVTGSDGLPGDINMSGSFRNYGDVRFDEEFHMSYYASGFNIAETGVADYRFFIATASGNIGLGTNMPVSKLHAVGDIFATTNITASGDISASGWGRFGNFASISGSFDFVTCSVLEIQPDTDAGYAKIGRSFIGHFGHTDWAGFSHLDYTGAGEYALLQGSGYTLINTPTGGSIQFRINNADQMIMDSNGDFRFFDKVGVGSAISANSKLYVDGDVEGNYVVHFLASNNNYSSGFDQPGFNEWGHCLKLEVNGSPNWTYNDQEQEDGILQFIGFYGEGGIVGSIGLEDQEEGVVFEQNQSDIRLKQNVRPTTHPQVSLDNLMKFEVVDFEWKKTGRSKFGFIAQDLLKIYPKAVVNNEAYNKKNNLTPEEEGFNYMKLNQHAPNPLIVKSIQEQQKIIKKLEQRITALEQKIK